MKPSLKNLFLISIMIFTMNLSCGWFSSDEESRDITPLTEYLEEKRDYTYFSDQTPGKWKDQANDHMPQYAVTKSKDKKYLLVDVNVPFKGTITPSHYIECIILTDHNGKEMQKISFNKGTTAFYAQFKLPSNYKAYFYIIAKCNLHDMWRVKVFPSN